MKIWVHTIVKNEEKFIWYALNSVIDYVDKILVWDNGSTDNTVEIIKSIRNPKVEFQIKKNTDVAKLRQEMLEKTDADWIFLLDGDEIWWEEGIEEVLRILAKDKYQAIVHPLYMLVGDIYHYQGESAGRYKIGDLEGHYNIRFMKKTPGIRVAGVYPNEHYVNKNGRIIQKLPENEIYFSKIKYLHLSHLKRSNLEPKKFKSEIGTPFPSDFYYPEVLFRHAPSIVNSPWEKLEGLEFLKAKIQTPLRSIKRKLIS